MRRRDGDGTWTGSQCQPRESFCRDECLRTPRVLMTMIWPKRQSINGFYPLFQQAPPKLLRLHTERQFLFMYNKPRHSSGAVDLPAIFLAPATFPPPALNLALPSLLFKLSRPHLVLLVTLLHYITTPSCLAPCKCLSLVCPSIRSIRSIRSINMRSAFAALALPHHPAPKSAVRCDLNSRTLTSTITGGCWCFSRCGLPHGASGRLVKGTGFLWRASHAPARCDFLVDTLLMISRQRSPCESQAWRRPTTPPISFTHLKFQSRPSFKKC